MKISVIVPIYNAEKYLIECIDSILKQTYTDFELLLVNDGSNDSSAQICDEYSKKDSRIKVFYKRNGGVSSARNLALENIEGDWVTFVDADDMLTKECLEICVNKTKKDNLDLLQFLHSRSIRYSKNDNKYSKVLNNMDFLEVQHNICIGGTFVKSSIIRDNVIRFNNEMKLAEDQLFVLQSIYFSRRLEIISDVLYIYRRNGNSATSIGKPEDILMSCRHLIEFKQLNTWASHQIDNTILGFLVRMTVSNKIPDSDILSIYESSRIRYYDRCRKNARAFYLLSRINLCLALKFFRISCRIKSWIK